MGLAGITHMEHSFTAAQQESTSPMEMGHLKKLSIISPACSPKHDTSWQEITYVFDCKPGFFFFGDNFTDPSQDFKSEKNKISSLDV